MGALRLFLALSVVIWHLPSRSASWVDAGVAVLMFFIISGFYMALVINETYGAEASADWRRRFYASRLFRLFPAYLVMVAIMTCAVALSPRHPFTIAAMGQPLPSALLIIVMNVVILGQDFFQLFVNSLNFHEPNAVTAAVAGVMPPGFFDARFMVEGQAWSLASELLFYALAPFVVRRPRRILALFTASLALRWGLVFGGGFSSEVWGYNFFPGTLCLFLLGSLAYHLYARVKALALAKMIGLVLAAAIALFALASMRIAGGVLLIDRATGYDTPLMWLAYLGFALSLPFLFAASKSNKIDRWIGELSYPLYLVHGLTIGVIFGKLHRPAGDFAWESGVVLLSIAAAIAMLLLVDRPVDAWRHRRFTRRDRAIAAPALSDRLAEAAAGESRV
jgi:peptidoglycan/LPS O-acetylase OafA/YrhL